MGKKLFDSKEYIRKVPMEVIAYVNGNRVRTEKVELERAAVYEVGGLKRIVFTFKGVGVYDQIRLVTHDFNAGKNQNYPDTYLTFVVWPRGTDHSDQVIYYSDYDLCAFGGDITCSGCNMLFGTLDDNDRVVINGQRHRGAMYSDFVDSKSALSPEEMEFVRKAMVRQQAPDWFLSKKDLAAMKKSREKEIKAFEKKDRGSFMMPAKKEPERQEGITTSNGEFVNPKSLKIHQGSSSPEYDLANVIGLTSVKDDIDKMRYMLEYADKRAKRGIYTSDTTTLHMCFMGNPGTGKTMISRIMTGLLYSMGYIKKNQCIEVSGLDLTGGYVGQTGAITKQIVDMARGGILFVDEAYALNEGASSTFGSEAVSVLLKEMEDNRGDLVVILAGYKGDMDKFLNMNSGFRSRINKYFDFEDYTTEELGEIYLDIIRKMHLKIEEPALIRSLELFLEAKKMSNFSNGRFVRNLAEKMEEEHILHSVDQSDERMDTVTLEDIPETLVSSLLRGI